MKKMIISFLFSLHALSLGAMNPPHEHVFGYKSTASYSATIEKLRTDPHPWAGKFLRYMEETERQNRDDLQKLLDANNAMALPCEELKFKEILYNKLLADEKQCDDLLNTLNTQNYKIADHWVLFTGLRKMVGIDGAPGILRDSCSFITDHAWVCDGSADQIVELYGNQVTVAKNSLIQALATKEGDPDVIKNLHLIHPTPMPLNDVVLSKAKGLTLYDEDKAVLYKPSASYEFGADPKEIKKNIWDCSSFIALVIDSDFRFSTVDFEQAMQVKRGEIEHNERTKSIMRQMDIVLPGELEFMDIIVWRGHSGGGHMAFYLGEGEQGIIVGDSNRTDDKSMEGTGISETSLYKDNKHTYVFRMKDSRRS